MIQRLLVQRPLRRSATALAVILFVLSISGSALRASETKDTRPVKHVDDALENLADASTAAALAPPHTDEPVEEPRPPAVLTGNLDFNYVEMLAIQERGRKKPLQSYVTEQIEQIVGRPLFSGTPYLTLTSTGERIQAMDLFLSIWFNTRDWKKTPVILVEPVLRTALGLEKEEKHFSIERLTQSPKLKELWESLREKRSQGKDKEITDAESKAQLVEQRLMTLFALTDGDEKLNLVPHPSNTEKAWISLKTLSSSFDGSSQPYYSQEQAKDIFTKYLALQESYRKRDAGEFTRTSREFQVAVASLSPTVYPSFDTLDREVGYNKLRPFGTAWLFYFSAVIVGLFALKFRAKPLYGLLIATYMGGMIFQVYGIALRCLIAGRPPVSNMYESIIWVGFGAVFFGLVFELIYRARYFAISGAAAGFMCLVLTDLLPAVTGSTMPGLEPTINPLVPVLRDNYWLTVHVLTITLSYAAFMLAWFLGHITLATHLFKPQARSEHHELHNLIYRVIQVGVLLLACGTILGGVWAYESWGRFWGWDPKETWAFITLMCYLVVLHGRFSGMWTNFGLAVGSVVCFQAVVMAWYGVNFVLGKGLHSYGKGEGGIAVFLWVIGLDIAFTLAAVWSYQRSKNPRAGV